MSSVVLLCVIFAPCRSFFWQAKHNDHLLLYLSLALSVLLMKSPTPSQALFQPYEKVPPPSICPMVLHRLQRCQWLLSSLSLRNHSQDPTNYPSESFPVQDLQRPGPEILNPPALTTFQATTATANIHGSHDTSIKLSQIRISCLRRLKPLQEIDSRKEWCADNPFTVKNSTCADTS